MTGKPDITNDLPDELAGRLASLGVPAFRARQIFAWVHKRLVTTFDAMTDLPAALREELDATFQLTTVESLDVATAPDGTAKYLFRLADGQTIETVYLPEASRATVCVSTMVGCPFGCVFCATGQGGFVRNLTAAEIVGQVYRLQAAHPERRITNIVYMGMGEPLANYDHVLRSVRLLIHPRGLDLAQRHITISTVGLVPGIERLADEGLQVNLAISLHAATQAARAKLVPIAKKYDLDSLMAATRAYVRRTGRKVTFEYTVVPGSNDRPDDAAALAALVRHLQSVVNLIPLNPTDGLPAGLRADARELQDRARAFANALQRQGVEAALRKSRGGEVTGACGQLRQHRG